MAKKSLGKGLGALFNTDEVIDNVLEGQNIVELKLTEIEPNKQQPRRSFDEDKLGALAESIKEYGEKIGNRVLSDYCRGTKMACIAFGRH